MPELTFLVDDSQWLDASRPLSQGDCIEVQLQAPLSQCLVWRPLESASDSTKRIIRVDGVLHYFSGEVLTTHSSPIDVGHEDRGKIMWESLLDCGVPILALGLFHPEEIPLQKSREFVEGLGCLWGLISFDVAHLSKTVLGTITNINELPRIPLSSGPLFFRRMTIDTSLVGPPVMKLFRPKEEKTTTPQT